MKIERKGKILAVGGGVIEIDTDPDNPLVDTMEIQATAEEERAAARCLYEDVTITIEIQDE